MILEESSNNYKMGDKVQIIYYTFDGVPEDLTAIIIQEYLYMDKYKLLDVTIPKYDKSGRIHEKNVIKRLSEKEYEFQRFLEEL